MSVAARVPRIARGWQAGGPQSPGATIALSAVTMATTIGMGRLFVDASFLPPLALLVLATHFVAWACRRAQIATVVSAVATGAAASIVVAWTLYPQTTAYGIPWLATLDAAQTDLQFARAAFVEVVAPAAVLPGFVLAAALGIAIAVFMADWAAFRLHAGFEAGIPSFSLFLFTSALGAPRHRGVSVALYVGCLLVFLLTHQIARQESTAWFGGRVHGGRAAVMKIGAGLGFVAVVGGLLLGPRLPWANAAPVIAYRNTDDGEGGGARSTVSPLVDINRRLIQRANIEVFTVEATAPRYWRLMSLDKFDGRNWTQAEDTYRKIGGRLDTAVVAAGGAVVEQSFSISQLASLWLPAAYRPDSLSGVKGVSWNAPLGNLITAQETSDGLTYDVKSIAPTLAPGELTQAPDTFPDEIAERFLPLPSIPENVRREAFRVIGRGTTYDRALRLQNYFRTRFTYDISVEPGHDDVALERFLFQTRRGYCEQFAGAYAVMARAAGIPARVAVGYTPGRLDENGIYHVFEEHGHAWPEVYIEGFGWIAFEPTPGRGQPGAESYTGVPPAQAEEGNPQGATALTTPTTVAPAAPTTTAVPPTAGPAQPPPKPDKGLSIFVKILLGIGALLLLSALWAGAVPLLRRRVRTQRHARARTVADRVMLAWDEARTALARAGVPRHPAETLDEFARRVRISDKLDPPGATALQSLTGAASQASYADGDLDEELAALAAEASATVGASAAATLTPAARALLTLDPRDLTLSRRGAFATGESGRAGINPRV